MAFDSKGIWFIIKYPEIKKSLAEEIAERFQLSPTLVPQGDTLITNKQATALTLAPTQSQMKQNTLSDNENHFFVMNKYSEEKNIENKLNENEEQLKKLRITSKL